TGDLARWMEDGNVDFIGRIDHQVKIRGYRIELGEIETAMLRFAGVRQAVVIDRTDERGQKYLAGYAAGDEVLSVEELQAYLEQSLPSHMVPARMMKLERLPLTPNGKVDRKALPEPEGGVRAGAAYAAPKTVAEKTLAAVWQAVLGVEKVGILDNFFELGGDSIKALQVASRLLQAGYKLDMKDLFAYPTVADLSHRVRSATRMADQSEVVGEMQLTPVQLWFFEQKLADAHHHNQSVMLYRKEGFDEAALRVTMKKIAEHHDALRTVFRATGSGYTAWSRGTNEGELFSLEVLDFSDAADVAAAVEAKANEIQSGIDLDNGPLMKLGLFHCPDGDHLLIAIHHLVVDGVSWRILFEDIATGYEQALRGEAIRFPHKTDSFRTWAEQLALYANGPAMERERAYWQQIERADYRPLPKDYAGSQSLNRDSETVTAAWTPQETELLLKKAHPAYGTEMNDLLLTALGMAVHEWSGIEQVLVNLEGHGREAILPELDITRTVGWFTSQFPIVLDIGQSKDVTQRIKRVKEGLHRIPQKGIGYGILRYLSARQEGDVFVTEPEISFNYLGQFDQDVQSSAIGISPYPAGAELSLNAAKQYALDINGLVSEGALQLTIRYSGKEYSRETMERLAGLLEESLRTVVAHCAAKERPELTPSDVLLRGLTIEELEQLAERTQAIGELENVYALTPMQKGMLFHSLLDAQSGAYFEQTTFELRGRLDVGVFENSLNLLLRRHEIFRTNFFIGWKDQPVQVVFRSKDNGFAYMDLSDMNESERAAYLDTFIREDRVRGFDLEKDPLMRVSVLRTGEETYRFVWSSHHILMDGWCVALMTGEVFESYFALMQHKQPELAPVTPYSQYIEWLEAQDAEEAARYWSGYLAGYEQQTLLPTGKPQVKTEGQRFETSFCDLGKPLTRKIDQLAKQHRVTLHTLLQTVWGLLLHKYNGSQDAVFGSVVSGRPAEIPGIENMIGLFINTIPVRVRCEAEERFADVMRRSQEQALASQAYETYPLYEIQALTEQKQDLVNHIMVFENYPVEERVEQLGSAERDQFEIVDAQMVEQTNYDFNLLVMPGEAVKLRFEYNALVYDGDSIERMQYHFIHVLEQIAANPQIRVSDLEVVTPQEQAQIIDVFNATAADYPREQTIHGLIEAQAERTPDHTAVYFEGERLTYRELNERANRLARTLRDRGVSKDRLVGLMTERSLDLIVGIVGILKAGGAYVPIDPEYPEERIRYMLDDSGAELLLLQSGLRDRIAFAGIVVELDAADAYSEDGSNLTPVSGADDLAYVIYTSGTTGKPKGVMVEHHGLCNLKTYFDHTLHIGPRDKVVQFASYSFDAACWEFFQALFCGATLYIPTSHTILNYEWFEKYMAEHGITIAALPPTYAVYLEPDHMPDLRILFTAGSASSAELVQKWKDRVMYYNGYGPTENSVATSVWPVSTDPKADVMISIGRPVPNHRVYMVDPHGHLLPIGVAGELCVAGAGLARGYLHRPELTAEKFVMSRFAEGERMYRTGDLARWMPDGNIEYLGRIDHQVKIRGYRIELGEVEAQIMKAASAVQETIVIAREDASGQNQLCAYFVADCEVAVSELRSELAVELPNYMVPSYFVQLEQMPLTPNGKIDRKALPAPEGSVQTGVDYVAPRTWVEAKLVQIWQEVLGTAHVGVKENFFDIGGHSLRATTLASKIHKELNKQLPLRSIFEYPTVEQLARVIEEMEQVAYASIPVTAESEYYPASSAQKRLYVLNQLEGEALSYNMPSVLTVEGPLDRERVEEAFRRLIARHETLRTGFRLIDGEPVQRVVAAEDVPFRLEVTQADEKEAEAHIRRFVRPFDLEQAPLLRAGLIQLGPDRHLLMLDMHHIISDGVSMGVLTDEFVRLYGGEELPSLRIQYKDYAAWQQADVHGEWMKRQEAYWLDVFRGELPVLDLPTDYPRPAVRSFEGDTVTFTLGQAGSERLRQLAAQTGSTLYMVLLAAYMTLLHKYTGQEDVVVGTPIAGRPHADLEPVIGMFVNTLALRSYPAGEKTFLGYLQEIKEHALKAYEHQDYPFEELVEKLQVKRDMSRSPLFDTMFVLQNTEDGELGIEGLTFKPYPSGHDAVKFDLTLNAAEAEDELQFSLRYAEALYKRETVERMAGHFVRLLESVADSPQAKLAELEMITLEETAQLQTEFNDTTDDRYPQNKTLYAVFEEQVERAPDRIAVVFEGEQLTYGELNERANRVARVLRAHGVTADQPVAMLVERSPEMIVGMLAVLKAGGAYVPIDPQHPEDRIRFVLEDSGAKLLLTQSWQQAKAAEFQGEVLCLDETWLYEGPAEDVANLEPVSGANNLAYLIYTSGTTGQPKGVMIEQRSVVNFTLSLFEPIYAAHPEYRNMAQLAPYVFDMSVKPIYGALLLGLTLHIVPEETRMDGDKLLKFFCEHAIDITDATPTYLAILVQAAAASGGAAGAKHYVIGGEALTTKVVKSFWSTFGEQVKLTNVYGPTECTVDSTIYEVEPQRIGELADTVPIGRPLPNQKIWLLDAEQRLVPIGVAGELHISGAGVARGYNRRPELTEEKFVQNPYESGGRMYKTGDLARWLPDGTIEYMGRIDHQVKIRGYRIELGEVESGLMSVAAVREAVVIARENESGEKDLCAYYVADEPLAAVELRAELAAKLPGYMIPSYFVQVERMPLTPNGKLDRKALPAPEGGVETGTAYVAPRTALEARLTQIWQDVLKLPRVGVQDNFFDIGGQSLRATTLVAKIHQELQVKVPLRDVFHYPTVEQLAQSIAGMEQQAYTFIPAADKREYYPASSAQKRLYMLSHVQGGETSYNMPGVMKVEGPLDRHKLEDAFRKLIARHETLRTGFEMVDGEVVQRIYEDVEFVLEHVRAGVEEADKHIGRFVRPFDLEQAPLLRAGLIELEPERHLLMYDMHHLISDGVSAGIIVQELAQLYEGEELPPLRIQYKDYAVWQQQETQSERYLRRENYWLVTLAGELPVLDLPVAYPRPPVRSFEGALLDFAVEPAVAASLHRLAADTGSTMYMVLMAAYTVLLSKYSGQEDLIVGTPVAGRLSAELEPLIGMFVGTLAIRNYPRNDRTFYEYLLEVKERTLQAFEHQDYPFEELVEKLKVKRDASRNPVFDTMFIVRNMETQEAKLDKLSFTPYGQDHTTAKFDLTLSMSAEEGEIRGSFEYCTKLFGKSVIERLTGDFLTILSEIGANPELALSEISVSGHVKPKADVLDSIDFVF
ncbi:non-ribosomal peptide synthetase, partial [Paenibacillus tyrfis]|uniref:non-ribosomal peptide synthetase n=1 Tax=Paenibacillus tyrfis TaxID=1501230 RepID=UPI002491EBE7